MTPDYKSERIVAAMDTGSSYLTRDLNRGVRGDQAAMERAATRIQGRLLCIAGAERRKQPKHHSLETEELVHEVYVRLATRKVPELRNRRHFYNLTGLIVRQILVDHARRKIRRGVQLTFNEELHVEESAMGVVRMDDALNALEKLDKRQAKILELDFFGGLTDQEIARAVGISANTVRLDRKKALEWLREALTASGDSTTPTASN